VRSANGGISASVKTMSDKQQLGIVVNAHLHKAASEDDPIDVASLARRHTEACISVVLGILSDADAPVSVRIKAAKILLNRDPTNRSLRGSLVSLLRGQRLGLM
jgi:hypothetical protein